MDNIWNSRNWVGLPTLFCNLNLVFPRYAPILLFTLSPSKSHHSINILVQYIVCFMPRQACLLKANLSNYMPSYHVLLYHIYWYKCTYLDIYCVDTYLQYLSCFFLYRWSSWKRLFDSTLSLPIEIHRPRWLRGRGQALRARRRNGSWLWNAVRFWPLN